MAHEILTEALGMAEELVKWRRDLHRIPELGLKLPQTAAYITERLFHEAQDWFCAREGEARQPFPQPFDHNMYIILNLAVGGFWVGYPDETVDYANAVLSVDYVRVYQKK